MQPEQNLHNQSMNYHQTMRLEAFPPATDEDAEAAEFLNLKINEENVKKFNAEHATLKTMAPPNLDEITKSPSNKDIMRSFVIKPNHNPRISKKNPIFNTANLVNLTNVNSLSALEGEHEHYIPEAKTIDMASYRTNSGSISFFSSKRVLTILLLVSVLGAVIAAAVIFITRDNNNLNNDFNNGGGKNITTSPTLSPTTSFPTLSPTKQPILSPTRSPTESPIDPTKSPTRSPTHSPTTTNDFLCFQVFQQTNFSSARFCKDSITAFTCNGPKFASSKNCALSFLGACDCENPISSGDPCSSSDCVND